MRDTTTLFHTNDIHSHLNNWGCLVRYLNDERRGLIRPENRI
ncbi:hypothetical protein [Sporolactobacillus inulinus]|nr:hypothetical protein [Sporolactobacillus inulinus]